MTWHCVWGIYMFNLILWIIWLAVLLTCAFLVSNNNLCTPLIGFLTGFFVQAVFAINYVEIWELDFCPMTMGALFLGSGTFFAVTLLVQSIARYKFRLGPKRSVYVRNGQNASVNNVLISVERWKLWLFLVYQLLVLMWLILVIVRYAGTSLTKSIFLFRLARSQMHETLELGMPAILVYMKDVCISSAYIWSYIFIHGIIYKNSSHKTLLILNIVLSLLCALMFGGRGCVLSVAIAAGVQAYFIYGERQKWRFRLRFKTIAKVILLFLIAVLVFQKSASLLGRDESGTDFAAYLAKYLSAELKNLDIFAREGVFHADITTCYTIESIVRLLGEIFHIPSWIHYQYIPYRRINGFNLGNVATIFYAQLHDGGLPAVIFYMAVMAAISQWAFQKAKRMKKSTKIRLDIIIYSYMFQSIAFSFFSGRFYEEIVCPSMLKILLSWALLLFVLNHVRFAKRARYMSRTDRRQAISKSEASTI